MSSPCDTCAHRHGWQKSGLGSACVTCTGFKAYEEETPVIVVPSIIKLRWSEAVANPSMPRWRSLAQLCSAMWVNCETSAPGSTLSVTLRELADLAHQHQIDMQPRLEVVE